MTACSNKPIYVQQPFLGFTKYKLPPKVDIMVDRNCRAYGTTIGDCVRVDDVKKLVTKIKTLEGIIKNYQLDIEAYNILSRKTVR